MQLKDFSHVQGPLNLAVSLAQTAPLCIASVPGVTTVLYARYSGGLFKLSNLMDVMLSYIYLLG